MIRTSAVLMDPRTFPLRCKVPEKLRSPVRDVPSARKPLNSSETDFLPNIYLSPVLLDAANCQPKTQPSQPDYRRRINGYAILKRTARNGYSPGSCSRHPRSQP